MKTITINGRSINIRCTMRTLCTFEARTGKNIQDLITALQSPMDNLQLMSDVIDILCGEPICEDIDNVHTWNELLTTCSGVLADFFQREKGAPQEEGNDEEGKEKNA